MAARPGLACGAAVLACILCAAGAAGDETTAASDTTTRPRGPTILRVTTTRPPHDACTDEEFYNATASVCEPQPFCLDGTYLASASKTSKGACLPQPPCKTKYGFGSLKGYAVEYLKGATSTKKGICAKCRSYKARTQDSAKLCQLGEYFLPCKPPSGSLSIGYYGCANQPSCSRTQFLDGDSTEKKGKCVEQPTCNDGALVKPPNKEFLKLVSANQRGRCTNCANQECGPNEWRSGSCGGTQNKFACNAQPSCAVDEFLEGASESAPGTCASCVNAKCSKTRYRTGACSNTTGVGFKCPKFPTCTALSNEYLSAGGTAGAKLAYSCKKLPTCADNQFFNTTAETCMGQPVCVGDHRLDGTTATCKACPANTCGAGRAGDPCAQCPEGQFQPDACASAATPCTPWQTCPAGEHSTAPAPSARQDRNCSACEAGRTWQDLPDQTSCKAARACPGGVLVNATLTTDAECRPATTTTNATGAPALTVAPDTTAAATTSQVLGKIMASIVTTPAAATATRASAPGAGAGNASARAGSGGGNSSSASNREADDGDGDGDDDTILFGLGLYVVVGIGVAACCLLLLLVFVCCRCCCGGGADDADRRGRGGQAEDNGTLVNETFALGATGVDTSRSGGARSINGGLILTLDTPVDDAAATSAPPVPADPVTSYEGEDYEAVSETASTDQLNAPPPFSCSSLPSRPCAALGSGA